MNNVVVNCVVQETIMLVNLQKIMVNAVMKVMNIVAVNCAFQEILELVNLQKIMIPAVTILIEKSMKMITVVNRHVKYMKIQYIVTLQEIIVFVVLRVMYNVVVNYVFKEILMLVKFQKIMVHVVTFLIQKSMKMIIVANKHVKSMMIQYIVKKWKYSS